MKPTTDDLLRRVDHWLDQARDDSLPVAKQHRAFGNAARVLDGMTQDEAVNNLQIDQKRRQ